MKKTAFTFLCFLFSLGAFAQDWTWVKGGNTAGIYPAYGAKGVSSPSNFPGARHASASWMDAAGNLWMFGGEGLGNSGIIGWLNDVWKYDPSTNEWTWMKGDSVRDQSGIYGTQGVSSLTNNPGGREFASHWVDAAGNFWMFGGDGWDAFGTFGRLNDLWKYDPSTNEWTWMKGGNLVNQLGNYGSLGVSAPSNNPGCRYCFANFTDASGDFWLMGGYGFSSTGPAGDLNDLWRYKPSTNEWTWMKGSNLTNQYGTYGTMGISSPTTCPGSREFASGWTDGAGNFWVHGGYGYPASGSSGYLNDLWKYNPSTNRWTWMKGTFLINQNGTYGSIGVSASTNLSGARYSGHTWVDKAGMFWLFGGFGYPASGGFGRMNDLWRYNPATNEFTWMKGPNIIDQYGVYGTQGVSAPANTPGARYYSATWTGALGDLWLWAGSSFALAGPPGNMNELWKFIPPCNVIDMTPASKQMFCSGNTATLSAASSYTGTVNWYPTFSSTTSIATGTNLTVSTLTTIASPTSYTFFAEVPTCSLSPVRIPITLTVNPNPTVTAVSNSSLICAGQSSTLTGIGASNYNWYPGNLNGTTIAVSPSVTTTFTVIGIDANGCSDTSNIQQNVSACTNILSVQKDRGISVFPNPSNGSVTVMLNDSRDSEFRLFDQLGREVYLLKLQSGSNIMDLRDLPKSFYRYTILERQQVIDAGKLILE